MIINSAYSLTTPMQHNPSPDDSRWATIWKLSVPERERECLCGLCGMVAF